MDRVKVKNGWDLAQAAKKAIITKITKTNKTEAAKLTSECKMENLATSAYLRLARTMDSSKVDAMGREAKQDANFGYKTIPSESPLQPRRTRMPSRILRDHSI